jgi:drug/metabolite transporter (DMT)-like permease
MLMWAVLPLGLEITLRAMDPNTIIWYRFLVSALLLGGVLAYRGTLPPLASLPRNVWALLAVATAFLAINYLCFLLGLQHTSPANSQVLIQLAPVLLAMGGLWVFGERFTLLQWLGFAMLIAGLGTFVRDQSGLAGAALGEYRLGTLLMLLAAVTWAIYGLAQKQLLRWLPSQGVMLCIYAGCVALFLPLSTPRQLFGMGRAELWMLLFCSLNTVAAYGTFAEALAHWEASRVAAVLALTPVMTIASTAAAHALWPSFVEPSRMSGVGVAGVGLVVVGALGTALGQRRAPAIVDYEPEPPMPITPTAKRVSTSTMSSTLE